MPKFYSPTGNFEVWAEKPEGYYTEQEWQELHPAPPPPEPTKEENWRLSMHSMTATKQHLWHSTPTLSCTMIQIPQMLLRSK
jgi:hypothetical protein